MRCEDIQSMLSAYIDGEVQSSESKAIEEHLSECASCTRMHQELKSVSNLLAMTADVDVPEMLLQQIEAATIHRPTTAQRLRAILEGMNSRVPQTAKLALASTAAAGVLLTVFCFHHVSAPSVSPVVAERPSAPVVAEATPDTTKIQVAASPAPVKAIEKTSVDSGGHAAYSHHAVRHHRRSTKIKDQLVAKVSTPVEKKIKPAPSKVHLSPVVAASTQPASAVQPESKTAPVEIASVARTPNLDEGKSTLDEVRAVIANHHRHRFETRTSDALDDHKASIEIASIRF